MAVSCLVAQTMVLAHAWKLKFRSLWILAFQIIRAGSSELCNRFSSLWSRVLMDYFRILFEPF